MSQKSFNPCPFCGGKNIEWNWIEEKGCLDAENILVSCTSCVCTILVDISDSGQLVDDYLQFVNNKAIKTWNKRAIPDIQADIKEFMLAAKQSLPDKPTKMDDRTSKLRFKLCWEEFREMMEGIGADYAIRFDEEYFACSDCSNCLEDSPGWEQQPDNQHFEKLSDGCADLIYVALGTLIAAGIDFWPIWKEVQRSNMSKFIDGWEDEHGKWRKGPSFSPPNIAQCLKDQEWED